MSMWKRSVSGMKKAGCAALAAVILLIIPAGVGAEELSLPDVSVLGEMLGDVIHAWGDVIREEAENPEGLRTGAAEAGAEKTGVLERMPVDETGAAEEPPAPEAGKRSGEDAGRTETISENSNGLWIYGPEKMKPGTKKYFKARFDGEHPRKLTITWSLDCDREVAQVFGNGQVWIRPKTQSGTVITLICNAAGKDGNGQPWTAEATIKVEVK